jgi:hypothetical protein
MILPAGNPLSPATERAIYCFPSHIYVHGVDDPMAGNITSHNNLPLSLS